MKPGERGEGGDVFSQVGGVDLIPQLGGSDLVARLGRGGGGAGSLKCGGRLTCFLSLWPDVACLQFEGCV